MKGGSEVGEGWKEGGREGEEIRNMLYEVFIDF